MELKRHGAELIGTCPFHEDKTPSPVVSPKTNLWHFLGKCNIGGSTIDWVIKTKGVSFRHAVELLRADHPSLAAGEARVVKKGTTAKLNALVKAEADYQEARFNPGVVYVFHATGQLTTEDAALRLLPQRFRGVGIEITDAPKSPGEFAIPNSGGPMWNIRFRYDDCQGELHNVIDPALYSSRGSWPAGSRNDYVLVFHK